ncbi:MAG: METTL5 family protein [Thermofilum sp.]
MNIKRKQLERCLNAIPPHPKPRVELEQYTTPTTAASTLLWIAEFHYGDLSGKKVIDLGCGTGRLGIGAALLGAGYVVMVDIDELPIQLAKKAAMDLQVDSVIDFLAADVSSPPFRKGRPFDTAVQNPPFGVHRRGFDILFLRTACTLASVVYSLHKRSTENFVRKKVTEMGSSCEVLFQEVICIPPMFFFHKKRRHCFEVSAIRVWARPRAEA